MNFKFATLVIILSIVFSATAPLASPIAKECKPLTEKAIWSTRNTRNPELMTGAALIGYYQCSHSGKRRQLLERASRIELPKGLATFSLIDFEFCEKYDDSSTKPLIQRSILNLLHDDKDNAQSYYLNALLQESDEDALSQIIKGNDKTFNSYSKQRFNAIVKFAEREKLSNINARNCAFSFFAATNTYVKLRHLCRRLIKSKGKEARKVCFDMGEKLEQGSLTFVEQMVSFGIQNEALSDLTPDSAQRMVVDKKVDRIFKSINRSAGIKEDDIPEDNTMRFWKIVIKSMNSECKKEDDVPEDVRLHFYEILLNEGEYSAQEFVYKSIQNKQNIK